MATLNRVECLRIENRTRPQKQRIYWLLLHWSDGSVIETEKPHSVLLDFRRTLKKSYGDSRDIHIPEVPSLKIFEIGNASKKDEKRKKSVDEFFRQVMQLPKLMDRVDPLMEFFASSLLQHDRVHSPAGLTMLYAEVSRPNLNGGAKARNIDYVALDIQQPDDRNCVSSSVPLSVPTVDTLYAEIAPNSHSGLTAISDSSTKPHTGMKNCMDNIQYSSINTKGKAEVASSSSVIPPLNKGNREPFNTVFDTVQPAVNGSTTMNQSYVGPQYQNFPITTPIPSEDHKLYIVTQSFIPSTACSQYLAVENGDIVEIQATSGDKVFCTLHMKQLHFIEGWLPKNILKCVPPDFRLQSSNTSASIQLKSSVHSTDFHKQGQQSLEEEEQEEEEDGNSAMVKTTKLRGASYFVGFLSRHDCENLLLAQGKQLDFIIRESPNLVGHFAISVKHDDHVHHFPIVLTEDNKFYIGKHHFKTVDGVITYYQRNDLYVDENGSVVRLGNPLMHNLQDDFK